MVFVIEFSTDEFDLSREPENDINPIAGQSALAWLKPRLEAGGLSVSEPGTEDWGWYVDVEGTAGRYLIGASATPSDGGPGADWILQVHRKRGLGERLRGRGKLHVEDAVLAKIVELVRGESAFRDVDVRDEA